ncbi:MAG: hypothetical protein SGJ17_14335 [Hyphomicrobiales bacterium]|nr:hypothetical protein [Hyphomicrobiales bacterium]
MEKNADWRQLGAVVNGVVAQLEERRRVQQRFVAEAHAEITARAVMALKPGRKPASASQLELPLFMTIQPQPAPSVQI